MNVADIIERACAGDRILIVAPTSSVLARAHEHLTSHLLERDAATVTAAKGREAITFDSHGEIRYTTPRAADGMRGYRFDLILLARGAELRQKHLDALIPTLHGSKNATLGYAVFGGRGTR